MSRGLIEGDKRLLINVQAVVRPTIPPKPTRPYWWLSDVQDSIEAALARGIPVIPVMVENWFDELKQQVPTR
jgi:hypothetical protein